VARVRRCQRPRYGFYVDHVVDVLGTTALLGGYALSGFMHPLVAAAMLVGFLMVMSEVLMATHCIGDFHLSYLRMGPTELRIALIVGNSVLFWRPAAGMFDGALPLFDVAGIIGAAGLFASFVAIAARHTAQLYREETR
jgi:hypothetical protein